MGKTVTLLLPEEHPSGLGWMTLCHPLMGWTFQVKEHETGHPLLSLLLPKNEVLVAFLLMGKSTRWCRSRGRVLLALLMPTRAPTELWQAYLLILLGLQRMNARLYRKLAKQGLQWACSSCYAQAQCHMD